MAFLRNMQTNQLLYLLSHHTFGRRSSVVDTLMSAPEISKIHAVIKWDGEHWNISSLGRNGSWLDKDLLTLGDNYRLKVGQVFYFANLSSQSWRVENLDAPQNLLIGLSGQSETEVLTPYHLIPNQETPAGAIYLCNQQDHWVLEDYTQQSDSHHEHSQRVLENNDVISLGHFQWQILLHDEPQPTVDLMKDNVDVSDCQFLFEVSLDEEHTELTLQYQHETVRLGERSHHYLLLYLARLKHEHAQRGIDYNNQGWVNNEQVARDLGLDIGHINIQIFRARKQISEALPNILGVTQLLQRRRGEVRFNCPVAQVVKGEESEMLCA